MSCFDTVFLPCPRCGHLDEGQSKSGDCCQDDYSLEEAPERVLSDLIGDVIHCLECGSYFKIAPIPRFTVFARKPDDR